MKKKQLLRFTLASVCACTLVGGSVLPMAKDFTPFNNLTLVDAANDVQTVKANNITYSFAVHSDNKTCTLYRMSNDSDGKTLRGMTDAVIPEKIPTTNYTITELGNGSEAIFYTDKNDKTPVKAIVFPASITKINNKAVWWHSMSTVDTYKLYLDQIKFDFYHRMCSGDFIINDIQAYDYDLKKFVSTRTVENFEKYWGILYQYQKDKDGNRIPTTYKYVGGDRFDVSGEVLNSQITLLNSLVYTKYGEHIGYEYAKKVVKENGFDNPNIPAHTKYMMLYNYIHTHAYYSGLNALDGNEMVKMAGIETSPVACLGMHTATCAGMARSYQYLCRASGLNVNENLDVNDVFIASVPGHEKNIIRLPGEDKFYIVDLTDNKFMDNTGAASTYYANYVFGTGETEKSIHEIGENKEEYDFLNTDPTYVFSNTDPNTFHDGTSCFKVESLANTEVGTQIEICDSNPNNPIKFINYTAAPSKVEGKSYTLFECPRTDVTHPLYVPSSSYLTIKINGETLQDNNKVVFTKKGNFKAEKTTQPYGDTYHYTKYSDYHNLSVSQVEDCYFDESDGTLYLNGNVDKKQVQAYAGNANVKSVVAVQYAVFPADCSGMFQNFAAATIDLSKGNADKVTNTTDMFKNCPNLKTIKNSNFTAPKTTTTAKPVITTKKATTTAKKVTTTAKPVTTTKKATTSAKKVTTTAKPVTTTKKATTTTAPVKVTLYGDANCDKTVDISDVVLLKAWLLNSNKYSIAAQGIANADVQGTGNGINSNDVLAIQKYSLKLIDKLPV